LSDDDDDDDDDVDVDDVDVDDVDVDDHHGHEPCIRHQSQRKPPCKPGYDAYCVSGFAPRFITTRD